MAQCATVAAMTRMFSLRFVVSSMVAGVCFVAAAVSDAQQGPAASPPMGWNSWDAYGLTITEQQFRDDVTVMKEKLAAFGWKYAVIDEGWYFENPGDISHPEKLVYAIDAYGRYVPVPQRFPSAGKNAGGPITGTSVPSNSFIVDTSFKELSTWVHRQGLLFGIHIVRGIPRVSVERNMPIEGSSLYYARDAADTSDACPWDPTNWGVKDNAAGQAWYDSLLKQYAEWGVDLLKVDCIADHPYKVDEIRMIRRAMDKAGRPMVLSLSPGPTQLEHADEVAKLSTMWRVSNDVWDLWRSSSTADFPQDVVGQFDRAAKWAALDIPAGHWPDLDMLPFGELRPSAGWGKPRSTRLTADEQETVMTLWSMKQSPLILGANLTMLDAATLKLVTNRAVLEVDQHGTKGRELLHEGDLRVWRAELPGGRFAVAMFNVGDEPMLVDGGLTVLTGKMTDSRKLALRDVWTGVMLGKTSTIAPHGCVLLEGR